MLSGLANKLGCFSRKPLTLVTSADKLISLVVVNDTVEILGFRDEIVSGHGGHLASRCHSLRRNDCLGPDHFLIPLQHSFFDGRMDESLVRLPVVSFCLDNKFLAPVHHVKVDCPLELFWGFIE